MYLPPGVEGVNKVLEWQAVDSSWIEAAAYDVEAETIYLRFDDGVEWAYEYCAADEWSALMAQGQSPGKYFHSVLKHKPNARWGG
jgi:hypothetical protein